MTGRLRTCTASGYWRMRATCAASSIPSVPSTADAVDETVYCSQSPACPFPHCHLFLYTCTHTQSERGDDAPLTACDPVSCVIVQSVLCHVHWLFCWTSFLTDVRNTVDASFRSMLSFSVLRSSFLYGCTCNHWYMFSAPLAFCFGLRRCVWRVNRRL